MSKDRKLQSSDVIWSNLEAVPDETNNGRVQVSKLFWSVTAGCIIHYTGIGSTLREAMSIMVEEYHQRR